MHLAGTRLSYVSSAGDDRLIVALDLEDREAGLPVPHAREVLAGVGTVLRPGKPDTGVQLPARVGRARGLSRARERPHRAHAEQPGASRCHTWA